MCHVGVGRRLLPAMRDGMVNLETPGLKGCGRYERLELGVETGTSVYVLFFFCRKLLRLLMGKAIDNGSPLDRELAYPYRYGDSMGAK